MILRAFVNTVITITVLFCLSRFFHLLCPTKSIFIHTGKNTKVLRWIFTFYVVFLLMITVFRQNFDFQNFFQNGTLNLSPFTDLFRILNEGDIKSFIYLCGGNIVWFIPFGLLFPLLFPSRPNGFSVLLSGFLLSLLIEFLQYAFGTGVSETDDLILNSAGVLVGYLLYLCFNRRKQDELL